MKVNWMNQYHAWNDWDNRNYPGHLAVFTEQYFAFWSSKDARQLCIRRSDSDSYDRVILPIGGKIDTQKGPILPDPSTFRMVFPKHGETGASFVRDTEGNGGDRMTMKFAEDGGGYTFTYTVVFREDNVSLSMEVAELEGEFDRIPLSETNGTWLGTVGNRGTKFRSDLLFDPCPQSDSIFHHGLDYHVATGISGLGDTWFTPCPFCIPVKDKDFGDWIAVCAEPTLDELMFISFEMIPTERESESGFFFRYFSLPKKDKTYVSPPVVLRFWGKDEEAALRLHAEGVVRDGKAPRPERPSCPWGKGLMACGWTNQHPNRTEEDPTGCRQEVYEEHMATFDRNGIPVKIITIDDFWGDRPTYGVWEANTKKWPDLRGFAEAQHAKGRYVLLWCCVFTQGLDEDEIYSGTLDPMSPKYRERVKRCMHTMLSADPGCYHCDGIKLDFTGGMAWSPEREVNPLFGMRYLYEQFKLYHDAAKEVRPDCLLDFQIANPYFASFYDMSRMNDFYMCGDPELELRVAATRSMIARASGFDPFVDLDCGNSPEFYEKSGKYGNVSVYLTNKSIEDPKYLPILKKLKKDGETD